MKIRILFFAQLREVFGKDEWIVEAQDGMTAEELVQSLIQKTELQQIKILPFLYAVNEQFESGKKKLCDQDVLALMTPMAGG